jgi:hypothetical protein
LQRQQQVQQQFAWQGQQLGLRGEQLRRQYQAQQPIHQQRQRFPIPDLLPYGQQPQQLPTPHLSSFHQQFQPAPGIDISQFFDASVWSSNDLSPTEVAQLTVLEQGIFASASNNFTFNQSAQSNFAQATNTFASDQFVQNNLPIHTLSAHQVPSQQASTVQQSVSPYTEFQAINSDPPSLTSSATLNSSGQVSPAYNQYTANCNWITDLSQDEPVAYSTLGEVGDSSEDDPKPLDETNLTTDSPF